MFGQKWLENDVTFLTRNFKKNNFDVFALFPALFTVPVFSPFFKP